MSTPSTQDELLELEHAGWRALCDGSASAFYADTMTEDGVMVLAHGQAMDRDAVVTSLAESPAWDSYEIREPRLLELSPDAATLLYSATATRDGAPPFTALMTSTYVRRGSSWRLACYTQSPVPEPAD